VLPVKGWGRRAPGGTDRVLLLLACGLAACGHGGDAIDTLGVSQAIEFEGGDEVGSGWG
jgi:hypothetical protein